jgi:hypothetical protein
MGSTNDECGSSSKKTIAKRGVTRLPKIHKAKSNGNRIEVKFDVKDVAAPCNLQFDVNKY